MGKIFMNTYNQVAYTDSLPIIDHSTIQKWLANPEDLYTKGHIALSDQPSVFKGFNSERDDVVIWRPDIDTRVFEFVSTACENMGSNAAWRLKKFIKPFEPITLDNEDNLVSRRQIITSKDITKLYKRDIDAGLAEAFADFYLSAIRGVLRNLPPDARLIEDSIESNMQYHKNKEPFTSVHPDSYPHLILNLTDPGTPFRIEHEQWHRTQAGDISIHSGNVIHAAATKVARPSGAMQTRFFSSFEVRFKGLDF
jgi:hypothetical protein